MIACWVNGVAQASVNVTDRGLHYGDGLFETMRRTARGIRQLDRHLARLSEGCDRLAIERPDEALLRAELAAASDARGAGVIKLIVTRGEAGRGYRPPAGSAPTRLVAVYPAPDHPAEWASQGVEVRHCRTTLASQPALAGVKHLNRLEQVLARAEWADAPPQEGLMADADGRVVCGTMTNLFVVRGKSWYTPRIDRCGVAGTMRAALIARAAANGIVCEVTDLSRADVAAADELFLTNAVIGAWPVRRLEGEPRRPGPAVRLVQEWIRALD